MAAVAAGYRKGLVSAGWPVLLLFCTNKHRKRSFHLVGTPFLVLGSFQSGGAFSGRRTMSSGHCDWEMSIKEGSTVCHTSIQLFIVKGLLFKSGRP